MIRIKCPKCQQVLSLDDALAGTICSCDHCGQRFKAPQPKAAAAAVKKPAVPAKNPAPAAAKKAWQEGDDFTPYAVIQPEESDTRIKDDDRIDQMVKDSFRQKKRERAWDKVGMPAKLLKLFSMLGIGVFLLAFILCSIDCILYIFKLQQHLDNPGKHLEYPVPTMFLFDFFDSRPGEAPAEWIWAGWFGFTLVMFALYAITISGAENLRSLGSYTRAMIGSIIGLFVAGPAGILALFAVLDEDVKLQFAAYKKELHRREEKEWNTMQEQIQEELEEREEAEQEGRPYRPHKRIKAQREAERAQQSQATIVMAVGGLIFLLILAVVSFFFPPIAWVMVSIGSILSLVGLVQLVIVGFHEDAVQGLLLLFCGPYALYFVITRWDQAKGAFFTQMAGWLFWAVGWAMVFVGAAAEVAK